MCEQALRALCFGKGNHVANGLGTGHQSDDAVQTKSQATMRWGAVLQSVEQEAEFELRFFGRDLQSVKYFLLHVGAVNTHRTTANFPTVQDHVIAFGNALLGCCDHPVFVTVFGGCERVMHGGVTL